MWCKEIKDNHLLRDMVVEDSSADSRTTKVFNGLRTACETFDLSVPIWLDVNINEFKRIARARFTQDSFIEQIPFDFLEIKVIEEDFM